MLRLQQQAGNAAVASLVKQPERRAGRIGPPPRALEAKTHERAAQRPVLPPERAPAVDQQVLGRAQPSRAASRSRHGRRQQLVAGRIEAGAGRRRAPTVSTRRGPTAEEGQAQLDAARAAVDAALLDTAAEMVTAGTSAGATVLGTLAEGAQAGRAQVAAAVGAAVGALLATSRRPPRARGGQGR